MAEYLALRIISGVLDYCYVVGKRADLKSGIDESLVEKGRGDLITICNN